MSSKNIALAVITKHLNSISPYVDFIENAYSHKIPIKVLIIVYSHGIDEKAYIELKNILKEFKTDLKIVKANNDPPLQKKLKTLGVSSENIKNLTIFPLFDKYKLIPYGNYRNIALLTALTYNPPINYFFFIDTDIYPYLLKKNTHHIYFEKINFFKEHLKYLKLPKTIITSSDYSGYYILPPLELKYLKNLLIGLEKEKCYTFLKNSNHGIKYASQKRKIKQTNKVLGGNLGINFKYINFLPPFYSTTFIFKNKLFLGRGEDTLLTKKINKNQFRIIDIDLKIFHNTYDDFPKEPSLDNNKVKDRIYFAATGWIGRNHFMNWLDTKIGNQTQKEWNEKLKKEYKNLLIGSRELAFCLNEKRFLDLGDIFLSSYNQLDKMSGNYFKTIKAWSEVKSKLNKRECALNETTFS